MKKLCIICLMMFIIALSGCAQKDDNNSSESVAVGGESSSIENSSSNSASVPISQSQDSSNSNANTTIKDVNFDTDFNLVLVNKTYRLSKEIDINFDEFQDYKFDERIISPITKMFVDAKKDGCTLKVTSAHRTLEYQTGLFNKKVREIMTKESLTKEQATIEAEKIVAPIGASEHCTGLVADIVSDDWFNTNTNLNENFEKTKEFKWLSENAYKYGFIIRYPKDKVEITGYSYEPWHYRYVGYEVAKQIFDRKICLEEFLQ